MADIRIVLELDDGDLPAALDRSAVAVERFENRAMRGASSLRHMEDASKDFLKTMRDVTVAISQGERAFSLMEQISTSWIRKVVDVNAEFERMVSVMRSLSTAADPLKQATQQVTELREMAKQAPFALGAIHKAMTRITAAGLESKSTMTALMDAVAAFGGTDNELNRASLAFQEMAGKGVVQMKELRNQLMMAVPSAGNLIARAFGESYEQVMADIHTGTVDARSVIAGFTLEAERAFGGAAQRQMKTFNGLIGQTSVLLQSIAVEDVGKPTLANGRSNDNGFFGVLKQQLVEFNQFLDSKPAHVMGQDLGDGLIRAVQDLRAMIGYAIRFKSEIKTAAEALALGFATRIAISGLNSIEGVLGGIAHRIGAVKSSWSEALQVISEQTPAMAAKRIEAMKWQADEAANALQVAAERSRNAVTLAEQARLKASSAPVASRTAEEQNALNRRAEQADAALRAKQLERARIEAESLADAEERIAVRRELAAHARDKADAAMEDPEVKADKAARLQEAAYAAEQRVIDQEVRAKKVAADQMRQIDAEIINAEERVRLARAAAASAPVAAVRTEAEQARLNITAIEAEAAAQRELAAAEEASVRASSTARAAYVMEEEGAAGRVTRAWGATKALWPVLMSGLSAVSVAAPIAAVAIGILSDYFDIFNLHAKEAWENLEHYGASSLAAAEAGKPYLDQLQKEIDALKQKAELAKLREKGMYLPTDEYGLMANAGSSAGYNKEAADTQADLNKKVKEYNDLRQEGMMNDARRYSREQSNKAEVAFMAIQLDYNRQQSTDQKNFSDQVNRNNSQGLSNFAANLAYRTNQKKDQLSLYDQELAIYDRLIAANQKFADDSRKNDADRMKAGQALLDLYAKRNDIEAQRQATEKQSMGLTMFKKGIDDEKLMKNAQAEVQKLYASTDGYKSAIEGADEQAEKLYETWKRLSKAGDKNLANVQAILETMKKAKEEADDYQKIWQGGHKLNKDLTDAIDKLQNHIFKNKFGNLSEYEQIVEKMREGQYAGYGGNDPEQQRLTRLREQLDQNGRSATIFADEMTRAIGPDMATNVDKLTNALQGNSNALLGVLGGVQGIQASASPGNGSIMFGGQAASGDFYGRMAQAESGNSTQYGLTHGNKGGKYQFEKGTWDDLMKNHPDLGLTAGGWGDEGQANKAIQALGADNDAALSKAGIALTDQNRYMAMFMGASGATHFMRAMQTNPNASFTDTFPKEASYNPGIANGRNLQQVYDLMGQRISAPTQTEQVNQNLGTVKQLEAAAKVSDAQKAFDDALKKLGKKNYEADLEAGGVGKNRAFAQNLIREQGGLAFQGMDPEEQAHAKKQLLDLADKADAAETRRKKLGEDTTAAQSAIKTNQEKLASTAAETANALARLGHASGALSDTVQKEIEAAKQRRDTILERYTAGSPEGQKAQNDYSAQVAAFKNNSAAKEAEEATRKTQALREATMTQEQAAADRVEKLRQEYAKDLANFTGTEAQKAQIAKAFNDRLVAEQAALASRTPLAKQMNEWSDMTKGLQENMANTANSFASTLTQSIMMPHNSMQYANLWRNFSTGIVKNLLDTGIKGGMGVLMNGTGLTGLLGGGGGGKVNAASAGGGAGKLAGGAPMQLAGAVGGGGSKAAGGALGGIGAMLGIFHTGGVIGAGEGPMRFLNMASMMRHGFMGGAPRYHTGGLAGDEVPIIAQRGEGVFTKGQMAAIGAGMKGASAGGHQFTIHNNVSVNANGGDPVQNADLAKQIGQHVDRVARSTVTQEIMTQMRPGGMLYSDPANIFSRSA